MGTVEENKPAVRRAEREIDSDLGALSDVRAFIRGFCETPKHPFLDEDAICRLELALNEAVTNVIKHGYQGKSGGRIRIVAEADCACLTLNVCHRGKSFDPGAVPEPSFDGSRDGGFGLYIIRQCVDGLAFWQDPEGRNCMRLVINLNCLRKGGSDGNPC